MSRSRKRPASTTGALTPLGARLNIRRSNTHSIIEIDRWPISNATPEQCAAVRELFVIEFALHIANKSKHGASILAQPSIWAGLTTRKREQIVLARLLEIEARA